MATTTDPRISKLVRTLTQAGKLAGEIFFQSEDDSELEKEACRWWSLLAEIEDEVRYHEDDQEEGD